MIILLTLATASLMLVVLNFIIDKFDLLNPAFDFCVMIFLSTISCIFYRSLYNFELHWNTVLILIFSMSCFTFFNYLVIKKYHDKKSDPNIKELKEIKINKIITIGVIIINILTLIATIQYVIYVANSFDRTGNYASLLNMYNHITKFTSYTIDGTLARKPRLMTIGEPICLATSFIYMATVINNLLFGKKLRYQILEFIPFSLYLITTLARGSRSAAFVLILGGIFLYYTFWHFKNGYDKGNLKFFFILLIAAICCIVGFTLVRSLIGRKGSGIFSTLFPYLGGPIVNLDIFLQSSFEKSTLFGQQTFTYLYRYIGQKLNIDSFIYMSDLKFNSINGINVGNVYTTFFAWIKDFGYFGVIPLMSFLSVFYSLLYNVIKRGKKIISLSLIVYAYLFNSLIMLMFSNRFYGDIANPVFIKFLAVVIFLLIIIFNNKYSLKKISDSLIIIMKKIKENLKTFFKLITEKE